MDRKSIPVQILEFNWNIHKPDYGREMLFWNSLCVVIPEAQKGGNGGTAMHPIRV